MIQDKQIVIHEQEKDSNPILRVVYNKIRNLNKKIAQIQHINTLDPKTLKTAQINKLNKRQEILQEIKKQEEFAINYKTILIQNNLVYDKVDDLLKISTLIAVGKRIKSQQYSPEESANIYKACYEPIFSDSKEISQSVLSDEVIRIYHLLWKFLQKDEHYSQCRDYITYIKQIDERKTTLTNNGIIRQDSKEDIEFIQKQYNQMNLQLKTQKMKINSEVYKINFNHAKNDTKLQQINAQQSRPLIQSSIRKELSQDQQTRNSSQEIPLLNKQELNQFEIEMFIHQSTFMVQNKELVTIQEREISIQIHPGSPQNKPHKRNNKNKRQRKNIRNNLQVQVDFNVRKCSDTSLEPTPDKCKGKKLRYIQKTL